MSDTVWAELDRVLSAAAVRLCWSQWAGLGAGAVDRTGSTLSSVIDLEGLVLLSLAFREEERRLGDLVAWWAAAGASLTSLQRMRAVAKRYPPPLGEQGIRTFAALAVRHGDRRWLAVADPVPRDGVRPGKGPEHPALFEPCAQWARLRAGLGVGAKADTLAFLLGTGGAWASTRSIAFATGYSTVTVSKAASEMSMAGLLRATGGRPAKYMAPPRPWTELLAPDRPGGPTSEEWSLPPWRYWSEIGAFLAGARAMSREAADEGAGREYVLASRARDHMEAHRHALDLNGIHPWVPERFRGLDAVDGLAEAVSAVATWIETAL